MKPHSTKPRGKHPFWSKGPRVIKREWPHDEKGKPIYGVMCVLKDRVWIHESVMSVLP